MKKITDIYTSLYYRVCCNHSPIVSSSRFICMADNGRQHHPATTSPQKPPLMWCFFRKSWRIQGQQIGKHAWQQLLSILPTTEHRKQHGHNIAKIQPPQSSMQLHNPLLQPRLLGWVVTALIFLSWWFAAFTKTKKQPFGCSLYCNWTDQQKCYISVWRSFQGIWQITIHERVVVVILTAIQWPHLCRIYLYNAKWYISCNAWMHECIAEQCLYALRPNSAGQVNLMVCWVW